MFEAGPERRSGGTRLALCILNLVVEAIACGHFVEDILWMIPSPWAEIGKPYVCPLASVGLEERRKE